MKINKDRSLKIIYLILGAGILLRLLYVVFMPVVEFAQYDIGTVDLDNDVLTGHLGYIFWLVKNHNVPQFDPRQVYQFNHPPVHHILCALWVSFIGLFTKDTQVLMESAQYVTFIYSVVTLLAFKKILDEIGAGDKGRIFALAVFAFQPTIIMTAGSLNNDGAGLMFQMLAVWMTLRWYRTRKYKDIIGIALFIGIGMLSKLSAGLIAVPVGALFIYAFVKDWRDVKHFPSKTFIQYIAFGAVCFPIGLFWVIRCYLRFKMPFTYIAFLPDTSPQYVGMYSDFQRMFLPNPIELLKNLSHGSIGMGWNIWVQMFRTSALGECDLSLFSMSGKVICLMMMVFNFCIALWAFVLFVKALFDKKSWNTEMKVFWFLGWLIMMYSYFSFAYKYPHECSMNFRYVQYAMIPPLAALALEVKTPAVAEKGMGKTQKGAGKAVYPIVALYVLFSIMTLITWCNAA